MDWDEFKFIENYLDQSDIVVDVGANIGVYTLWMSRCISSKGKIIAFEPDPRNFERVKSQTNLNEINDRVILEDIALSNKQEKVNFAQGKDDQNYISKYEDGSTEEKIVVSATNLDSYARNRDINKVDFLKIDVEGGDLLVLKGARKMLSENSVDVIQFEVNEKVENFGIEISEIFSFLEMYNYDVFSYNPGAGVSLVERHDMNSNSHVNLFATHDVSIVKDIT